jgi:hypothetical protein
MTGLMDIFHGYDPEIRTGAQRGTIIVHRDSCRKDDATFNVFAITESPAQILVRVGRVQQSFDIDQVGKMISVPLPAALPDVFRISISTNATRATELRFGPRYDHNEAADVRMVLVHPQFVNVHE